MYLLRIYLESLAHVSETIKASDAVMFCQYSQVKPHERNERNDSYKTN